MLIFNHPCKSPLQQGLTTAPSEQQIPTALPGPRSTQWGNASQATSSHPSPACSGGAAGGPTRAQAAWGPQEPGHNELQHPSEALISREGSSRAGGSMRSPRFPAPKAGFMAGFVHTHTHRLPGEAKVLNCEL